MIKDYGYEVQKLYLELMLADAEIFVRCLKENCKMPQNSLMSMPKNIL
jgi:hypothetical protein